MEPRIIYYLDSDEHGELLEVELPDGRRCGVLVDEYGTEMFAEGMAIPQTMGEAEHVAWLKAEEVL